MALVLVAGLSGLCDDLSSTRELLERAQAFEINHLENDYGIALLERLMRCRTSPARTRWEAERHHEFRQAAETSRTSVEERFRRLIEQAEARCRASLT